VTEQDIGHVLSDLKYQRSNFNINPALMTPCKPLQVLPAIWYLQRVHSGQGNLYGAVQKQDVVTGRTATRMHLSNNRQRQQKYDNLHTMQT
jgi:hypothetical protein